MPTENLVDHGEKEIRTRWSMFFLLVGAGIATAFQVGKAPPALPMIRADLGLSLYLAGWVLSAFSATGVLIAPVAGATADWLGHRRFLLMGLGFMAAGSTAGAFAPNASVLLLSRFMEGLGYIFVAVSAPGLIVRFVHPRHIRLAIGIWSTFLPFGSALVMLLAPVVLDASGWRGLWQANGALLFAMLLVLAWATRDIKMPVRRRERFVLRLLKDVLRTLKATGPVLVALCFCAYSFQFLVVIGFLPTMLIEEQGMSQAWASILTAIALFTCVPANLVGGWMLQRGVKGWLLIAIFGVLGSLSCFGIYAETNVSYRFLFVLAFMMGGSMMPPAFMHGAVSYAPSPGLLATSYGILLQGSQLGLLIGPPTVAAVVSRQGDWQAASWILASMGLVMVALSLGLRSIDKRKSAINP